MSGIDATVRTGAGPSGSWSRWLVDLARAVAKRRAERVRRLAASDFSPHLRRDLGLPDAPTFSPSDTRTGWGRF